MIFAASSLLLLMNHKALQGYHLLNFGLFLMQSDFRRLGVQQQKATIVSAFWCFVNFFLELKI